jgi:hypothetical protein
LTYNVSFSIGQSGSAYEKMFDYAFGYWAPLKKVL